MAKTTIYRAGILPLLTLVAAIFFSIDDYGSAKGQQWMFLTQADLTSPSITFPDIVQSATDTTVTIPISFDNQGHDIIGLNLSIDFDPACLALSLDDDDGNQIPDSIALALPIFFANFVTVDLNDVDSEIDIAIVDLVPPFKEIPNGIIGDITFDIICQPAPNERTTIAVQFSDEPSVSFSNSSGQSVAGIAESGSIEIVDGPLLTPSPTPSPTLTPRATSTPVPTDSLSTVLSLRLPDIIQSSETTTVTVPIIFNRNEQDITSIGLSIDFDQRCLTISPDDNNGDQVPDAITLDVPLAFSSFVILDRADTDGEIDMAIVDFAPPFQLIPSGTIGTIEFGILCQPDPNDSLLTEILFSEQPGVSFGNSSGQTVEGVVQDGSIELVDPSLLIPTATSTPMPTNTAIPTNTPTATNTPIPTNTPTNTPMSTPTSTPNLGGNSDNNRPNAADDTVMTFQNFPIIVGVLNNDEDLDGDRLFVVEVGRASHGEVSINSKGEIVYEPNLHYTGDDRFTYTITDGVESVSATVFITVLEVETIDLFVPLITR